MRARSKKTAKVYRQTRMPLVEALLAESVVCVWPGCSSVATDPDEKLPRGRGGSITDPNNVQALCHFHNTHKQLPGYREIAERHGLLLTSASKLHPYSPLEGEYYCHVCNLPPINGRHRESA